MLRTLRWCQMKIRFDTTSGVDTKNWECLVNVSCVPDDETPDDLLSRGWLFDPDALCWYMSRSVRIDLTKWAPGDSSTAAVNNYEWRKIESLSPDDEKLLLNYRQERNIINYRYDTFSKVGDVHIERGESRLGNCWHLTVHNNSSSVYPICAFGKLGTKTSPGKACWTRACQLAKMRGSTHLYVYEGYGLANAYKANSAGFEWWDGVKWSDDKNLYLECLRDDFKEQIDVVQ